MKRKLLEKKHATELALPNIDKEIKECFSHLKNKLTKENNIVLFLGNGISEESLSVGKLFSNYIRHLAEKNPRGYDEKKKALESIYESVESKKEIDMTHLMNNFSIVEQVKNEFRSFVVEECCNARPTATHAGILLLVTLLSFIQDKKSRICCFTTNYDNLLERMFLSERLIIDYLTQLIDQSLYHRNQNNRMLSHHRFFPHHISGARYLLHKINLLRPVYRTGSPSRKSVKEFTIIPIHGSIRVSKCNKCELELQTEATAMNIKRCVYCGNVISDVIVPTAEGETDKDILEYFLKEIKKSNILIFIGYGFGDPHIMEKIKAGVEDKDILIINFCRTKLPEDVKRAFKGTVLNVEDNLNNSIGQFLYLLKDITTENLIELVNLLTKKTRRVTDSVFRPLRHWKRK